MLTSFKKENSQYNLSQFWDPPKPNSLWRQTPTLDHSSYLMILLFEKVKCNAHMEFG